METAFKNIVIKNGLFLGFSLALYEFIKYSAGILYSSNTGLSILLWIGSIGLYVYFINWGVNQYKNANNGQVTIADGLKIGAAIGAIAGVLLGIYNILYTTVIAPDYYEQVMALATEKLGPILENMPEDQVAIMHEEMLKAKPSVVSTFIYSVIGGAIGGLIIGLIIGLIRKPKTVNNGATIND